MRELDAISGIFAELKTISKSNGYLTNIGSNVVYGRAYYQDIDDLPVLILGFVGDDQINNQIDTSTSYNITSQIVIEAHLENDVDDLTGVYQAWRDITKAVLGWTNTTPTEKKTITYQGRTIIFPDEQNRIAVLQVRFAIQYIEDLTS